MSKTDLQNKFADALRGLGYKVRRDRRQGLRGWRATDPAGCAVWVAGGTEAIARLLEKVAARA